jgi:hypothetical protein
LLTPGYTLSKLSGNANLDVTNIGNGQILNIHAAPSAASTDAATGSILVTGTDITTLTFRVYLRSVSSSTDVNWSNTSNTHQGDLWLMGVSTEATPVTLPVKLQSFTAATQGCAAQLGWSTVLEENISRFEVEASATEIASFNKIGTVQASNNTNGAEYHFNWNMDKKGEYLFRLKIIYKDGTYEYSNIRRLVCTGTSQPITITPNPVKTTFTITGLEAGVNAVTVLSADGRIQKTQRLQQQQEQVDIAKLPSGVYTVRVLSPSGKTSLAKIVKE